MPELPEVESIRRQLVPELVGSRVVGVWWDAHPAARLSDVHLVEDRTILSIVRRGKYLICHLDAPARTPPRELILHLGMTGSLRIRPAEGSGQDIDALPKHIRASFLLADGRALLFNDPRRFGRVSVVVAGRYEGKVPTLASLGPEPLSDDFDPAVFARDLARTSATVKAKLLDQRLVAGIGNIYADESLWLAGIHPASRHVGPRRARRLHGAIQKVLSDAIDREGTTFRDYQMVNGDSGRNADFLQAYGQADLPCARCGTALRHIIVAARGTTYCPSCQRM